MDKLPLLESLLAIFPLIWNKVQNSSFKQRVFFASTFILAVFLTAILIVNSGSSFRNSTTNTFTSFSNKNLFVAGLKNFIGENPEMVLLQKNSIVGISSPLTITSQTLGTVIGEEEDDVRKEIIEYTVESGDTLSNIAEKFSISLDTILWANELSSKSTIKLGQRLIILPVPGVLYHVQKDDTLSGIAKTYKGDVQEIIAFNELPNEGGIYIGDILVIPNGQMPKKIAQIPLTPLAESYFIFPAQGTITQGLHLFNAVDIGNKCGEPVVAAASGIVQAAGWAKNAGNRITILHPNGVATYYGHLSAILVKPGQAVSAGEIIGYIGNTGYTLGVSGCHLHFGVSGANNFLAKYPVGSYLSWSSNK